MCKTTTYMMALNPELIPEYVYRKYMCVCLKHDIRFAFACLFFQTSEQQDAGEGPSNQEVRD